MPSLRRVNAVKIYGLLGILIGMTSPVFAVPRPPHISKDAFSPAELGKQIRAIITAEEFPFSSIGVKVVSLDKGEVLLEHNADQPYTPASTVKLITTAAALDILGPTYRFKTEVWGDSLPDAKGIVKGNLYLKGEGDPLLVSEHIWALVNALRRKKIKEVDGDLIVDDTFFSIPQPEEEKMAGEGRAHDAIAGALSFNFNTVTLYVQPAGTINEAPLLFVDPPSEYIRVENRAFTTRGQKKKKGNSIAVSRMPGHNGDLLLISGSLPIDNKEEVYYRSITKPALYAGYNFRLFLEQQNIKVKGKILAGTVPKSALLFLSHSSQSLAAILSALNHYSNNMIADQLLLTIGAQRFGSPGTYEKGLKAIDQFLREKVGLKGSWKLINGSGMSRENSLSPGQIVHLLEYMNRSFAYRTLYMAALTAPGEEGTLSERLSRSQFKGYLRGKTGSLDGVSCLSGYLFTESGELLAFSTMVNNARGDSYNLARVIDRISSTLSRFRRLKE
ncbi:MAG: D-alanyl-D-alanine carboxypeptidase/D-alanyl-D-alanine-endopeptidase [Deltaproteobacteria bacterium]|nr:D-alanyl-D-alanine carboxypeptidase/D-alanyl-D-alanine-endopeptidase [Deltaproteobacteria bacterium]